MTQPSPKEVTGGLDDTQRRNLEARLGYLREMEDRRAAILSSISEQGKLTDDLRAEIDAADSIVPGVVADASTTGAFRSNSDTT